MNPDRISSPIDSLESKWWYKLPDRIPAASAISRTVVARYPFCAKSSAAIETMSARRCERSAPLGLPVAAPRGTPRPSLMVATGSLSQGRGLLPERLLGSHHPPCGTRPLKGVPLTTEITWARAGRRRRCAPAVVFLASPASGYITGKGLEVTAELPSESWARHFRPLGNESKSWTCYGRRRRLAPTWT